MPVRMSGLHFIPFTKADMKKMYRTGLLVGLMEDGLKVDTCEKADQLTDVTFDRALAILKKERKMLLVAARSSMQTKP